MKQKKTPKHASIHKNLTQFQNKTTKNRNKQSRREKNLTTQKTEKHPLSSTLGSLPLLMNYNVMKYLLEILIIKTNTKTF